MVLKKNRHMLNATTSSKLLDVTNSRINLYVRGWGGGWGRGGGGGGGGSVFFFFFFFQN